LRISLMSMSRDFDWRSAPLSDVRTPLVTGTCYVLCVLVLNECMRKRAGFSMRLLQAFHNLALSLGSLLLALGTLSEVVKRSTQDGLAITWLFCEDPATQPRGALWFWSYLYYLSKYYELLDTVLQLLKGRPPPHFFLNVYHHAVVLLMAWSWLENVQSLSFIGLLFNASVHVVMYYYYFRRVLGWPVWWKAYVTQFQIVQFSFSALCGFVTLGFLLRGHDCAGPYALAFNFVFNMTLLSQFIGVLRGGSRSKGE